MDEDALKSLEADRLLARTSALDVLQLQFRQVPVLDACEVVQRRLRQQTHGSHGLHELILRPWDAERLERKLEVVNTNERTRCDIREEVEARACLLVRWH